jgi:DNA polymerase elongation subunit (family B)
MSNNFSVSELHGKVIGYDKIKYMPSRNSYLDIDKYTHVNEEIKKGHSILFMPNYLHEMHLQPKKYEKALYKIVLFGVLTDGREAKVVISGIRPSFEVVVDSQDTAIQLNQRLSQLKCGCPTNFEIVRGKQFKGYRKDKSLFAKFYFRKLTDRREALKFSKSQKYETTSDDMSSYYRVVCRDYMVSFSSWVEISNYKVREYTNIRGPVYDVNIKNYKTCGLDITTNPQLAKDNIMSCCWDIETYSPDGQLPRPENPDHKMFMIGLTFQWHHSNNQLLRVCLVDYPCAPKDNYLTIVCGTEKKIIKAFGKIVYKMRPDIYLGFNDAEYDWPWLIIRAKAYTGTLAFLASCFDRTKHWEKYNDENVFKYNFKKEKVKVEADTYAEGQTLQFPGYLNIDVRTMFRQLYPTAEKSNLNFYLKLNKLQSKNDMPYQELFRIYRELSKIMKLRNVIKEITDNYNELSIFFDIIADYLDYEEYSSYINKMADVADYCVVDSQRCHELMKIRSVLMDRREIANLSYTSVFDALYRANGMKVRNIVIARGQKRGIKFSNITHDGIMEDGKYPGAYVFPPIKGLVSSKLTIYERYVLANERNCNIYKAWCDVTVDDIKLYTTIIELYSPYPSEKELCEINNTYNIKQCFEEFLKENLGRPVTGLDFSSLYPSLIMAYNLSPEYIITNKKEAQEAHKDGHDLHKIKFNYNGRTIRGWSIRHDNKLDPDSVDCKFGIYPMILKELFDTRKLMKKKLHIYENQKEIMDALVREEFDTPVNKKKYDDICFNFNYINSKQKALKVFMNTFYGETGNKRSPFFVLQVAGAITTAGQNNIKMVKQYVEQADCKVYYGDSVTGDTPLVLRDSVTNLVYIKTIDNLVEEDAWKSYDQFKPGEFDRIQKQQGKCKYLIWTEGDWREIRRVIRHKTNKKMYRINTHTGCIDVTADHSLMKPDRTKIKPSELQIGTELLHSFPDKFPELSGNFKQKDTPQHNTYINSTNHITKEEAYVWGFFMADGSCSRKCSWSINSKNITYLNQAKDYLAICEPHIKFRLLDTLESSGLYKLVAFGHIKLIAEKYRKLFYYSRKYKLVPIQILNGSLEVRRSFYEGYKTSEQNTGRSEFCCKGKITAQCMYYLVKSLGYKYITVDTRVNEPDIYRISSNRTEFRKNPIGVKKILELPEVTQKQFVYDIETSHGSFLGGVGSLNVKNTDSLYLTMPDSHFRENDILYYTQKITKEKYWSGMVVKTFETIKILNINVNLMLIEDNGTIFLKMAFEESLFPCAFLSKKMYYGIPHISIPNFHPKALFIRGLAVKKRGVADILKKIYMSIVWDSVSLSNQLTLMNLVKNKIDYIYETEWKFEDFIKTDVFRPNKQNVKIQTFAKRMLDEGIVVKPHERFQYVIVKKNPYKYDHRGRKQTLLVGEKMEYVERAKNKNMSIDLDYYVKQTVVGQFARLITYDPLFHVEAESDEIEDIRSADEKIFRNANKYVTNYCSNYFVKYQSKGKLYQKIFRLANKSIIEEAKKIYGTDTTDILQSNYDIDDIEKWLEEKSEKKVIKDICGSGKKYVTHTLNKLDEKDKPKKIRELQNIYFARKVNSIINMREKVFRERQSLLQRQVRDNIGSITDVLNYQTQIVNNVSNHLKQILDIDNKYNDANSEIPSFDEISNEKFSECDISTKAHCEFESLSNNEDMLIALNKLRYIYLNMMSNYHFIHTTRSIVDYLKILRNRNMGFQDKPKTFDPKAFIKQNVDDIVGEMMSDTFASTS